MSKTLAQEVQRLRASLASGHGDIEVTLRLPRASAEKVLALLDAEQASGAVVIPAKEEFTTTEAARLLDMSRPTLMKLIHSGRVEFRKVGRHHRIPASAIQSIRDLLAEDHMAIVAELSNKYGNTD